MSNRRRVGWAAGAGVGAAAAGLLRRRWLERGRRPEAAPVGPAGLAFLDHLADAIRIPTISGEDGPLDAGAFGRFHEFLRATYPLVFELLDVEVVAGHSLLFRWEGTDQTAEPVLLHTHMDVVPVEEGTEGDWPFAPFEGVLDEEHLWGRGALDDKADLIAVLEAVETLLSEEFRPEVSLYLSIGHDEEVGGVEGAGALAKLFAERGVHFDFVLDEGGAVVDQLLAGIRGSVALVGVGEKGYADVELSASTVGGHASSPPRNTAIGEVASAVAALEAAPMPARLDAQGELMQVLGARLGGVSGFALRRARHLWGLSERRLAANPQTNALIRTTGAVTMIGGGVKSNVLPQRARAVANFRIMPGDTVESVLDHVRRVVGPGVEVRLLASGFTGDPTPISDTASASYRRLRETIEDVFPGVLVTPWILMAATDSRHFLDLADNVYRFAPLRMVPDDLSRIHGTGERFERAGADAAVMFYRRLVRRACGRL